MHTRKTSNSGKCANMSKVLVTGGAGFIGSHVAEEMVKGNYQVVVLDDLSGGFEENIIPGAEFVCGSISDIMWSR